ncbi:MAG: hypothetical protein CMH57_12735 [Myxococcales bacterium]|nr:hypothetical protein [Myxococcales bacterium]
MRCLISTLLSAVLLTSPGAAWAQDQPGISAEDLYQLARQHFEERKWEQAAQAFALALERDPNPILAYNVARSYEYSGDLDKAEVYYLEALKLNPDKELRSLVNTSLERVSNIKSQLGSSKKNVGLLDITTTPEGAQIVINGRDMETNTPYQAAHPSGPIDLELKLDGFETYSRSFDLEPGREIVVDTDLRRTGRVWTWVAMGTGAALLGGGIWTGIIAQDRLDIVNSTEGKRREDYEDVKSEGESYALTSVILYSAGAAALITAGYLYFHEVPEQPEEGDASAQQIELRLGPDFVGVGGRF